MSKPRGYEAIETAGLFSSNQTARIARPARMYAILAADHVFPYSPLSLSRYDYSNGEG